MPANQQRRPGFFRRMLTGVGEGFRNMNWGDAMDVGAMLFGSPIDPGFSNLVATRRFNNSYRQSMDRMNNSLNQRMPGVTLRGEVGPNPNLSQQQREASQNGYNYLSRDFVGPPAPEPTPPASAQPRRMLETPMQRQMRITSMRLNAFNPTSSSEDSQARADAFFRAMHQPQER